MKARNKKLALATTTAMLVVAMFFVPVYGKQSFFQQIFSSSPKQAGVTDQPANAINAEGSLKDVWEELQKIAEKNGADSLTVNGSIRLYDNLDDEGIREEQRFVLQQSGNNQRFKLETFENIHIGQTLILIDHNEKEIVTQSSRYSDSVVASLRMLSPQKLRKVLEKDGSTADITTDGKYKVLNLRPGTMDAVNEYNIYYDPLTYQIKKLKVAYTNFPYQDYLENYQAGNRGREKEEPTPEENNDNEEPAIEMNITEYIIEFEFLQVERKNSYDFMDNEFFQYKAGRFTPKQQLKGYKIIDF